MIFSLSPLVHPTILPWMLFLVLQLKFTELGKQNLGMGLYIHIYKSE